MEKNIIIVDDELPILRALKRSFYESEYNYYFVQSGKKALCIFSEKKINLIISDMRMPEMDGFTLLKIVKEKYPDTIRIILSGFTDKKIIIKSVIEGVAKTYFTKPWDDEQLKNSIKHLLDIQEILSQKKIINVINKLEKLPVLPALYQQIVTAIEKGDDVSQIAKIIEKEPVYTSNIMRVVNSSYCSWSVSSLKQALTYLGILNIKTIILFSTMISKKTAISQGIYQNHLLFRHANFCNYFTIHLYQKIFSKKIPEEYALSGLMHDIGFRIISTYFKDIACRVNTAITENEELSIYDIEKKVWGLSHSELGAYLADWWNLPVNVVEICLFHHTPLHKNVANKEVLSIIYIADILSWRTLGKFKKVTIDPEVLNFLHIDEEFLIKEYNAFQAKKKPQESYG